MNKAWEFECVLENGKELKSWFYSDTEQDASNRVKNFMSAKLISIKEIDDPLEVDKRQIKADKIRSVLQKKREIEQQEYLKQKEQNDSN
jgi:hypothetical protein